MNFLTKIINWQENQGLSSSQYTSVWESPPTSFAGRLYSCIFKCSTSNIYIQIDCNGHTIVDLDWGLMENTYSLKQDTLAGLFPVSEYAEKCFLVKFEEPLTVEKNGTFVVKIKAVGNNKSLYGGFSVWGDR